MSGGRPRQVGRQVVDAVIGQARSEIHRRRRGQGGRSE